MSGETNIVGFCGMSHLGLNSSVVAADKGFLIIGFDEDPDLIDSLLKLELTVEEPDLEELMKKNVNRITFTGDVTCLSACNIIYIAADVTTNDLGDSDLSMVRKYMDLVLRHKNDTAIVIVLSQVPPGFTRSYSQDNLALFYQVETLIYGRAIERAAYPERYIVGSSDKNSEIPLVYKKFLESHGSPPIVHMSYESAELAKIAINCMLVASISAANTLAELCERLDADWGEIVPALRLDKRIGPYSYIEAGLGLAGGNLERDLASLIKLGAKYNSDTRIVEEWVRNSRRRKNWCYEIFSSCVPFVTENPKVSVLGLAYKENTHSIKNSPALVFLEQIRHHNITVYDPVVSADGISFVTTSPDIIGCIRGCDILVIMTPWQEFKELTKAVLGKEMSGKVIIDPYGCLRHCNLRKSEFQYFSVGMPLSIGVD
jgi:UDPglucose 6-dehydrogenase